MPTGKVTIGIPFAVHGAADSPDRWFSLMLVERVQCLSSPAVPNILSQKGASDHKEKARVSDACTIPRYAIGGSAKTTGTNGYGVRKSLSSFQPAG